MVNFSALFKPNAKALLKLLTAVTLFTLTFNSSGAYAGVRCEQLLTQAPQKAAPWFEKIGFSKVESTLSHGRIRSAQNLKMAFNESGKKASGTTPGMLLVTFTDGTQALWKPGEKNRAEVAAYDAARAVGSALIPPTVFRTIEPDSFAGMPADHNSYESMIGQAGSLQYFVRTPIDLLKMNTSERQQLWEKVPVEQRAERDFFNFVFGNWDLHWGNVLVDEAHSIVQIDNGAMTSRQMVRFGELPFVRKAGFKKEARGVPAEASHEAFPFDSAIYLENPTLMTLIKKLYPVLTPKDLANFLKYRVKNFEHLKERPELVEEFSLLVESGASLDEIEAYLNNRNEFLASNMTMKIALWDNAVYIQSIGYANYKPIIPPVFTEKLIRAYKNLNFEKLRTLLPESLFNDSSIREMLERRDQIVLAGHPKK